jgi:hypothetical protein
MLQAQQYFSRQSWTPVQGHVLTAAEANALQGCLGADASALIVSSAVSIVDAIRGLQNGFFSWATVKLYYSLFYSLRAILSQNRYCVVYEGTKPRTVQAIAGGRCEKAKGNTHNVVIAHFCSSLPGHWLLSQEIALLSPPIWLMRLREQANYGAKFWEPECPSHFERVMASGIRQSMSSYLNDRMLAFDSDHAALAYPLQAFVEARARANPMDEPEAEFIRTRARDSKGPLSELIRQLTGG